MYTHTKFMCGADTYEQTIPPAGSSDTLYFINTSIAGTAIAPCAILRVIPKDASSRDDTASLQVSGYNICQIHPRQVERTLLVTF
jgi:hypothetical protein